MTKILPTIGPVSDSIINLKKIMKFSSILRLNAAHNTISWHKNVCNKIKRINIKSKILIDLPGIKPRTLNNTEIKVKKNEHVLFYFKSLKNIKYFEKITNVELSKPLPKITKTKYFSVSDGRYKFKIVKLSKNYIVGKSFQTFNILPHKGVNIPGSIYSEILQLKLYNDYLNKLKRVKYDAIGLSFVQSASIIKKIKLKFPKKILVSKIENSLGCKNANEIIKHSDVIMIDRGDLSAEVGEENLFNMVENISLKSKKYGKPLIIATENLDSMVSGFSPTKSEIISIAYSRKNYVDQIMLSDETATSINFYKTLLWLDNFLKSSHLKLRKKSPSGLDLLWSTVKNLDDSYNKLVVFTKKGFAIEKITSMSPNIEMNVFTDNIELSKLLSFKSNCSCFFTKQFPNEMNKFIFEQIKKNKKKIFNNKNVFLIYISFPRSKSRANTISFITKNDF
jgi:pyruvate kinase